MTIDEKTKIDGVSSFTIPADFDVDGMVTEFREACSGSNAYYEYTAEGFWEFANEYFEHY